MDSVEELSGAHFYFVAAYEEKNLLGCGAIKYSRNGPLCAEIKRVIVTAEARGRGVSKKIMASLEENARQKK